MKNINKNINKIIGILVLSLSLCFIFSGCDKSNKDKLSVTFIDISGALSSDHTINIKFGEEKDYEDKYIDILVKTDTDGVILTLFQEFAKQEDKIKLCLDKSMGYVSLDEYKLFNLEQEQTDTMVGYGDVLTTNMVINSNKDATLTFLAVLGDKDGDSFKQSKIISKEYTLKVRKKVDE